MGPITIFLGLVLIVDGVVGFTATGSEHFTALIPAAFGLVFVVLGWLARQEHLRKHVMHAAAALALIGFLATVSGVPGAVVYLTNSGTVERPPAVLSKTVMAVACAVFTGLCVKSFVDARRRRIAGEATAPSQP
jgi:hypothetical protein